MAQRENKFFSVRNSSVTKVYRFEISTCGGRSSSEGGYGCTCT